MQKGHIFVTLLLLGLAQCHYWQVAGEFTTNSFAASDVQGWQATGFAAGLVSSCNAISYVGGPGVVATGSISKSFTSDVPLKSVVIMFDLVLFDQWLSGWEGGRDQNTLFKLLVNNQLVHNIGSDYTRQLHAQASNICGGPQPDRQTRVSITVPVSGTQFTVTLSANIASNNANTASWGFRNFVILTNYGVDQSQLVVKELFDNTNFDASQWKSNFNNGISTCPDPQKLLGGFNIAGAGAYSVRNLSNIPPHSFLVINLNAYFVDSVDANDTVVVYVDGVVVHEVQKDYLESTANICGAGWNDNPQNPLSIVVPHFNPTAEIKIFVNFDQGAGDESFGFREFAVYSSMPCPIIYSDANQKGELLSFCGNIPNLQNQGWTFPIKGIYIPDGYSLSVYSDANYSGKKFSLKKSNFNLTGNEYAMVNKAFNIDTNKSKLRRNN